MLTKVVPIFVIKNERSSNIKTNSNIIRRKMDTINTHFTDFLQISIKDGFFRTLRTLWNFGTVLSKAIFLLSVVGLLLLLQISGVNRCYI